MRGQRVDPGCRKGTRADEGGQCGHGSRRGTDGLVRQVGKAERTWDVAGAGPLREEGQVLIRAQVGEWGGAIGRREGLVEKGC
jgi:hypothetical protein